MMAVFAGILKPDVRENPGAYYDRPFDVFTDYYDIGVYRVPGEWYEKYGPSRRQMDWGSWLYICDRKALDELVSPDSTVAQLIPAKGEEKLAKRLPSIKAGEIPETEWYGVLEVECY